MERRPSRSLPPAPLLAELYPPLRTRRQRFWEIEVVLAFAGIAGLASTMVRQDSWLLWSSGERSGAVVLEIEDTDEAGDKQYWIRVGNRGIWVIDDEIHAKRGDQLDVLFDPDDQMRADERRRVRSALVVGACAASLPIAWLLVGAANHLRRLRRAPARQDAPQTAGVSSPLPSSSDVADTGQLQQPVVEWFYEQWDSLVAAVGEEQHKVRIHARFGPRQSLPKGWGTWPPSYVMVTAWLAFTEDGLYYAGADRISGYIGRITHVIDEEWESDDPVFPERPIPHRYTSCCDRRTGLTTTIAVDIGVDGDRALSNSLDRWA